MLDHLGVERLHTVVGGSIGGMQALQWAVDFPQRVERAIAIGAAPLSAMGLALNHLQRKAIQLDPEFRGGRYAAGEGPEAGLALARGIAMCRTSRRSCSSERFARRPNRNGEDPLPRATPTASTLPATSTTRAKSSSPASTPIPTW